MKLSKKMLKQSGSWLLLAFLFLLVGCKIQPKAKQTEAISPTPVQTKTPTPTPVPTDIPASVPQIVGQASTKIFDSIPTRNNNLKIAIKAVNGTVLEAGEEFSFNKTVGPRTKENGYQEAIGYDENGEKVPTVGGGICQISSTLYMAAKNGGFPVTERHSHSHSVPYADSDHDATVSYEGYDFRFQNHLDKPIVISVSTNGKTVSVTLTSQ